MAAGKQLIEKEKIDQSLMDKLNELWISPEDFREAANQHFQSELDKIGG